MVIYSLDLFGVFVFAVTGALAAGRKKLDVFGIVVVAIVTAIGGGTIRDLVLGAKPVGWVSDPGYVLLATIAALVTFVTAHFVRLARRVLLVFDAFGLAVFTVIGCQKALAAHVPFAMVVVMGMLTGVAGGIIRDLLCGEIPLILRKEIYATASLAGGVTYIALYHFGVNSTTVMASAAAVVLLLRLAAIYLHLSLPVSTVEDDDGSK